MAGPAPQDEETQDSIWGHLSTSSSNGVCATGMLSQSELRAEMPLLLCDLATNRHLSLPTTCFAPPAPGPDSPVQSLHRCLGVTALPPLCVGPDSAEAGWRWILKTPLRTVWPRSCRIALDQQYLEILTLLLEPKNNLLKTPFFAFP